MKIDLFDMVPGDLIYLLPTRDTPNALLVISVADHELLVLYIGHHMMRLCQYPTVYPDGSHITWFPSEFIPAGSE